MVAAWKANETEAPPNHVIPSSRLSMIQLALDTYVDFDVIAAYWSDRRGTPSVECESKNYEPNGYG